MEKENAINFLLFSYFGITLDSDEEEILNAAIDRAYRDAASHVLSVQGISDQEKEKNTYRLREEGKNIIKEFIAGLKKPNSDYQKQHNNICTKLIEIYKNETTSDRPFTYGIAQKWVNMTMKYLCVITSVMAEYKKDNEYNELLKNIEKDLHVPIDSYILECINENKTSWSKIENNKDYDRLQERLKTEAKTKNETPLNWEGPAWIGIAKVRKQKEEQNKRKKYEQ